MGEFSLFTSVIGFVPGGIGGVFNVLVGHPVDLVKVRQQTSASVSSSTLGTLRQIFAKEGVRGLYAGVSAPLLAVVPAFAVVFWTYDAAGQALRRFDTSARNAIGNNLNYNNNSTLPLTLPQVAVAGGVSGLPLGLVLGPLERFKCLMQMPGTQYPSFSACVSSVYRTEGFRGVVRGTSLTILRDVPGNAAYFFTYECLRRQLLALEQDYMFGPQHTTPSMLATLVAGGSAGIANWLVALPPDVIKSRFQTAPAGTRIWNVFTDLLRTDGPAALYRGLGPSLIRAFPANAACLVGVETTRALLGPWLADKPTTTQSIVRMRTTRRDLVASRKETNSDTQNTSVLRS